MKCLFVMVGIDGFFKQKNADSGVRYGAFMPCIPITRRVGDFSHCAARVVNALLKRLEQSLHTEIFSKSNILRVCLMHPSGGVEVRKIALRVMKDVADLPASAVVAHIALYIS